MNKKQQNIRFAILCGLVGCIFVLFVYQLMLLQIAEGESYKNKATQGTVSRQTVSATRGEIVDRYGGPLPSTGWATTLFWTGPICPTARKMRCFTALLP